MSLVQSNLTTEAASRLSADNALGARIDTEVSDRTSALAQVVSDIGETMNTKFSKSGGDISGDVKLVDSYLNFGDNWRVKASADGSRIVFEYKKNGVWKGAVPFIAPA